MEKQDSSGSIVVVKEETKLLLSELSDQVITECNSDIAIYVLNVIYLKI